jgi:hypothetical protein
MSTASEEILARYSKVEKEADSFGRIIGVRRLKPAQMVALREMTPGLTGSTDILNEAGDKVSISDRTELMIAASVVSIDGAIVTFPRNRGELDCIYNGLDQEGMVAAMTAFARLHVAAVGESKDPIEAAKN